MFSQRAYTWPSFDHRVCIAICTCTPRLSRTLYRLLELNLSVFLVVILTHPRLCTVAVVAPYLAMCFRCGVEACGVCLWCGHVCAHVPGSSNVLMCGAIQAGPGHAHVPGSSDALTCGAIQAGLGHAHVPGFSDALTCGAIEAGPGHANVPGSMAPLMHSRVGRLKQALAMHMSVAPVMHARVGRFRQALAIHMSLTLVMHTRVWGDSGRPSPCTWLWDTASSLTSIAVACDA